MIISKINCASDTTLFQIKKPNNKRNYFRNYSNNQTVQAMRRPMRRLKSAIERSKKWKERDKSMPKVGAGIMPAHDLTLNNNASQWNSVLLLDIPRDILNEWLRQKM